MLTITVHKSIAIFSSTRVTYIASRLTHTFQKKLILSFHEIMDPTQTYLQDFNNSSLFSTAVQKYSYRCIKSHQL